MSHNERLIICKSTMIEWLCWLCLQNQLITQEQKHRCEIILNSLNSKLENADKLNDIAQNQQFGYVINGYMYHCDSQEARDYLHNRISRHNEIIYGNFGKN